MVILYEFIWCDVWKHKHEGPLLNLTVGGVYEDCTKNTNEIVFTKIRPIHQNSYGLPWECVGQSTKNGNFIGWMYHQYCLNSSDLIFTSFFCFFSIQNHLLKQDMRSHAILQTNNVNARLMQD